jgi:pimeloyl-ACP methyl ester carboxylesterase
MPRAMVNGVELYYEEHGAGEPIVWTHEYAGDYRSWEPQVRALARRYRVIAYSNRGYLPSAVPSDPAAYSQEQLVEDLRGLLDHLGIERAHIGGLSMGGAVALVFSLTYPERCRSAIVAGCGSGSDDPETFRANGAQLIAAIREQGMAAFADTYARGPSRKQFMAKDPHGWRQFRDNLAEHSDEGAILTFDNVQRKRQPIYAYEEQMRRSEVPTLIIAGDEDEPCLLPSLFMKRHIRTAGLAMLPMTGHTLNLEEPERFNALVLDFLTLVEQGRWPSHSGTSSEGRLF